jgi:hypothetical protein
MTLFGLFLGNRNLYDKLKDYTGFENVKVTSVTYYNFHLYHLNF